MFGELMYDKNSDVFVKIINKHYMTCARGCGYKHVIEEYRRLFPGSVKMGIH